MSIEIVIIFFYIGLLIYSVILHEVSHGVVALWLGDQTAKRAGRITLNPISHIDPFGSIILPTLLAVTTGFAFGWAKPVPYNPYNLRFPKWGPVFVGLAGPATNFLIALVASLLAALLPLVGGEKTDIIRRFYGLVSGQGGFLENAGLFASAMSGSVASIFFGVFLIIIFWNVILGCFNLLPIPPLDGSKLLYSVFNIPSRVQMMLEQYGIFILFGLVLLFPAPLQIFISAVFSFFLNIAA